MVKLWSKKEIYLLKKLYPVTRVKDLAKMFPERNKATIVAKAQNLNLLSAKLWHPEENKILKKYFYLTRVERLVMLLPKRSRTAIWAQGERLGLRQNRNKCRLAVNENYFKKWSPDMAYILGFILADGCIVKGTYEGYSDSLKFGVNKRDVDVLEKIKRALDSKHKISEHGDSVHFCITNQRIVDDLKKLKIKYRKSLKENIPYVPHKYTKDFIRGIIDGDGSISFDKRNYPTLNLCGGAKTVNFVQKHFLSKFDIYSKIVKVRKNKRRRFIFYITYRANSAKTLIEYLYKDSNLYLQRKFELAQRAFNTKIKHKKKL